MAAAPPPMQKINAIIAITIVRQKYDLAKFFTFLLAEPPNENTRRMMNPITGIENRISYPKYPHIEIGLYSSENIVVVAHNFDLQNFKLK